jgi:hypothetical protein
MKQLHARNPRRPSLQIRRARKRDRDAIWQIFRAVVARGDTYAFDPHISRTKALGYWFDQKKRCYVAISHQRVVGTYILNANQPGLGSHVANAGSWLRLRLKAAELAVPWASTVCARPHASAFVQCNSISSSLPTKLPCDFGKILDLELWADCRVRSATPPAHLLMFTSCIASWRKAAI